MKKINEKQYSEAKRAQSIACMDYNELSDCHCTTLTTENARLEGKVEAKEKAIKHLLDHVARLEGSDNAVKP